MNPSGSLLDLLVKFEYITPTAATMTRAFAERWHISAFEALLETSLMDEIALANALAAILKLDRLYHIGSLQRSETGAAQVSFSEARALLAVPMTNEAGKLELVVADPTEAGNMATLRHRFGAGVAFAVATRSDVLRAIDEVYPLPAQLPALFNPDRAKIQAP